VSPAHQFSMTWVRAGVPLSFVPRLSGRLSARARPPPASPLPPPPPATDRPYPLVRGAAAAGAPGGAGGGSRRGPRVGPPTAAGGALATAEASAAAPTAAGASTGNGAADENPMTVVKGDREKIGRNDPCWCGSGKKYKKCHGA